MSFYRTLKSLTSKNGLHSLLDSFALNYPAAYEFIFFDIYRLKRREDLGDVSFLRMRGEESFIQLKREKDFALKIPLDFPASPSGFKIAAVVHIFYPELADEMKNLLLNIPCALDVFISTTSLAKKSTIEKTFADFDKGVVTIRTFENRGRDIAASFVGFKEIYKNYDVCVHVHSKKSPHAEKRLAGWREHLYKNLLGSPDIVYGILKILANEKVGAVFPQYFDPIRISINWGKNYLLTKNFLSGLGIEIDNRHLIEFPAGSMFWFKPKALAPLLDSDLSFNDFPEECGQVDGTLAHAIERAFLFIVEASGFIWAKVDGAGLISSSQAELDANILKAWHSVLKKY